jgi:transcriptional regulator with XRE-family HTH domain
MFSKEKLKELREKRGLSLSDMSHDLASLGLRLTDETLRNWEKGRCSPTVADIEIIARLLKCPPAYFFDGKKKGEER